jgi:hypothetical protein
MLTPKDENDKPRLAKMGGSTFYGAAICRIQARSGLLNWLMSDILPKDSDTPIPAWYPNRHNAFC